MQHNSKPAHRTDGGRNSPDYGEVQIKQLNDRSKMYYTPNKENNVFQLVVQYRAGEREFPKTCAMLPS